MGTSGAGSGAAADDTTQSLDPAALRAGVKLQPGTSLKISVKGKSGRPLPSGRKARPLASGDDATDGTAPGAHHGDGDGGQSVDNSGVGSGAGADDDLIHILAAEVRSIGDTLMPNHPIRLWSIETGEQVGEGTTDENGLVHLPVPKDGTYRIELVEQAVDLGHAMLGGLEDEEYYRLVVRFVDAKKAPLANVEVQIKEKEGTSTVTTDAQGMIDIAASLKAYDLTVRGQKFTAHALPSADHDASANNASLFVVTAKGKAA